MQSVIRELNRFIPGWLNYFRLGLSRKLIQELNRWIIRRLRVFLWEQWKLPRTKVRNLKRLGMGHSDAVKLGNTRKGMAFLIEVAEGICRKHHISREHVFFGGEDCGTFALNFIYGLRERGFLVMGVNAKDAKEQRENMQASSDELDLLGIAKLLVNRRGSTTGGEPGAERALRTLTRHRKAQVRLKTATSNRVHQIVDQLFPGFLDEKSSGIPPISEASLYVMEDRFSPAQISARQDKALLRQLKAKGLYV